MGMNLQRHKSVFLNKFRIFARKYVKTMKKIHQKIVVNPKYEYLRKFVEDISEKFPHNGRVLQNRRNTIKVFELNGLAINVKRFRIPLLFNQFVYTFFRGTKASKAYHNSLEVISRGFDTPESIAFIEEYRFGLLAYSYYISLQCPYSQEIRDFYFGPLKGNEDFFTAFAQYTATLHEAGIYHLDYSPGNVLIGSKEGKCHFSLVDINRMKFIPVSLRLGCRNFERMFDNDELYIFLATEYAKSRNLDVQECIKWTNHYKNNFLKRR
jgi:serine/threonine protein kinase